MALQKDHSIKGVTITGAYHKMKRVIHLIDEKKVFVILGPYKDLGNSSDIVNEFPEKECIIENINGGDQNYDDYIGTVHATENIIQRIESYLVEKDPYYLGAAKV